MTKPLSIKNWELGIGESPYTGFAQMVNVDIYSKPGSLKISNKLIVDNNSAAVVDELIKWAAQDPEQGDVYAVDRNGKLYKRDRGTSTWSVITGHGTAAANGEGLAIWKGYLFYARRFKLDVMNLITGVWTNDWQTLNTSFGYDLHPMISSSQRFVLYVGNGNFVDTLEQVAGQVFDPTDPTTYVYNSDDLELGSDYRVTCLEEVGTDIAIGTLVGINGIINIADIFFWDGASDFIAGGKTVRLVENGVNMMKNSNNTLYTIAGDGVPRIFNSVTSQSIEAKRFNNINVRFQNRLKIRPGAIELKEGEMLFGIGQSGSNNLPYMGVYSLRNNAYVLRYLISTLRDGSTDGLQIGLVKSISSNEIIVSWQDLDNTPEFGVDIISNNFYTNYTAYVESPIYSVGTEDDPKTYEKVEVRMGKKLQTGDGVVIKARYSLDDTWVTIATFDTPTYTGKNTFDAKVSNLGKFKEIQFRIEMTTDDTFEESPELKEITFK